MIIKDYMENLCRDVSLVEQKKLQWAKEREEMAKLEKYNVNPSQKFEKTSIRTQFIADSKMIEKQFQQKNFNYAASRRIRSPSLPPIDKKVFRQGSNSDQSSGYKSSHTCSSGSGLTGSDDNCKIMNTESSGNSSDTFEFNRFDKKCLETASSSSATEYTSTIDNENDEEYVHRSKCGTPSSTTSSVASHDRYSISSSYANSSNIDSNYKPKEGGSGRAKWGSYMFDSYSSREREGRSSRNGGGPVWLEKSLTENRDSEDDTMSISVHSVSSFLRGQNVPVDPFIMAAREEKRRKAMELQSAIKEQLRERELMKKMEKEKKMIEERLEEERLKKQVQLEQERLDMERRLQREKQDNEKRKQETMRLALEKAELDAKIMRERKKRERALANQADLNETISIEKSGERTQIYMEGCQKGKEEDLSDKMSRLSTQEEEEEEDADSYLIGTPIKLRKKQVPKKTIKKQQNVSSDEETVTSFSRSPSKSIDTESMTTSTTSQTSQTTTTSTSTTEQSSFLRPIPMKDAPQTAGQKMLADLDGIALILQTMTPLVPLATINNDLFGLNHLNQYNLALVSQQHLQSRLSTPQIQIIPQQVITDLGRVPGTPESSLSQNKSIIENKLPAQLMKDDSRDTGFESEGKSSPASSSSSVGDKDSIITLDSPKPSLKSVKVPEKITEVQEKFGVSQVGENFVVLNRAGIKEGAGTGIVELAQKPSPPQQQETIRVSRVSPRVISGKVEEVLEIEDLDRSKSQESLKRDAPDSPLSRQSQISIPRTPQIPHDGTFTKEEGTLTVQKQDASTFTDQQIKDEVKTLTPQKYRYALEKQKSLVETTATQTDSFLFCEFCCFRHHHCQTTETTMSTTHCTTTKTESNTMTTMNQEIKTTMVRSKSNEKNKLENRPEWGVNRPKVPYIKASERDPMYARNRRKRYIKKPDPDNGSVCNHKDCPILTMNTTSPILSRKFCKAKNICTEILPIKTDRNGRVYLLHQEDTNNYLINEALKRHHQKQMLSKYKSLDYEDRFYSLPKTGKDFQNFFGE